MKRFVKYYCSLFLLLTLVNKTGVCETTNYNKTPLFKKYCMIGVKTINGTGIHTRIGTIIRLKYDFNLIPSFGILQWEYISPHIEESLETTNKFVPIAVITIRKQIPINNNSDQWCWVMDLTSGTLLEWAIGLQKTRNRTQSLGVGASIGYSILRKYIGLEFTFPALYCTF